MNERVLIIEDEPGLVLTLTDRLTSEGYFVDSAADGEEGLRRAAGETYDLVILDIMLPGKSGFEVCRELRRRDILTPILMLTARGDVADKVVGLKIGADDYLTKPFETIELLARIEALFRRLPQSANSRQRDFYEFGGVTVDFAKAEVRRNEEPVEMSARELRLLGYFIEKKDLVLSRDELLNKVWGYEALPCTRTVDVHVAWLRQKLEANPRHPQYILTVHGVGYKFVG